MKKIAKKIRRAWIKVNDILGYGAGILYFVLVLGTIFITLQAMAFCYVYLRILNNKEIFIPIFRFINIWGIQEGAISNPVILNNLDEIKTKIEFLMNISIGLSGILLSVATFISYIRKTADYKHHSCFQRTEIISRGEDDIKVMSDMYADATYVVIFSHSFGWIKNNRQMQRTLNRLARNNKLKLYTDDTLEIVKKRLENCGADIVNCIYGTHIQSHFSYVVRNNRKYLLYRDEESDGSVYVITVRENEESQYLLQVINELVK